MPNIASALKDEISRLARREVRAETNRLNKTSAKYRSEIAALKRRIVALEKAIGKLGSSGSKKAGVSQIEVTPVADTGKQMRFSPKHLRVMRRRKGMTAADLASLIGVAAQTVYNWETGGIRPRKRQMQAIASIRQMGRRELNARLSALNHNVKAIGAGSKSAASKASSKKSAVKKAKAKGKPKATAKKVAAKKAPKGKSKAKVAAKKATTAAESK